MRRTLAWTLTLRTLVGLCLFPLAGCGGSAANPSMSANVPYAASSSSPATRATTSTAAVTSAALGTVDVYACQSFVTDAGDAYSWLLTLERDHSVGGAGTPGFLEAYNLGGTASIYLGQLESATLKSAIQGIVDAGQAVRTAMDSRAAVDPAPALEALNRAADVCEEGGFTIDWHND